MISEVHAQGEHVFWRWACTCKSKGRFEMFTYLSHSSRLFKICTTIMMWCARDDWDEISFISSTGCSCICIQTSSCQFCILFASYDIVITECGSAWWKQTKNDLGQGLSALSFLGSGPWTTPWHCWMMKLQHQKESSRRLSTPTMKLQLKMKSCKLCTNSWLYYNATVSQQFLEHNQWNVVSPKQVFNRKMWLQYVHNRNLTCRLDQQEQVQASEQPRKRKAQLEHQIRPRPKLVAQLNNKPITARPAANRPVLLWILVIKKKGKGQTSKAGPSEVAKSCNAWVCFWLTNTLLITNRCIENDVECIWIRSTNTVSCKCCREKTIKCVIDIEKPPMQPPTHTSTLGDNSKIAELLNYCEVF